jgi:hypothetical protein
MMAHHLLPPPTPRSETTENGLSIPLRRLQRCAAGRLQQLGLHQHLAAAPPQAEMGDHNRRDRHHTTPLPFRETGKDTCAINPSNQSGAVAVAVAVAVGVCQEVASAVGQVIGAAAASVHCERDLMRS